MNYEKYFTKETLIAEGVSAIKIYVTRVYRKKTYQRGYRFQKTIYALYINDAKVWEVDSISLSNRNVRGVKGVLKLFGEPVTSALENGIIPGVSKLGNVYDNF